MFFNVTLYIALIVFGIGSLYKISTWFGCKIGVAARDISPSGRAFAAIKGIISTLFSPKILTLLRVFLVDVVLQMKTLQEDGLRWLMHLCIYWGFMLLLLMHALDKFITSPLFPDYQSTVNPFLALRDIFGAMVLIGIGIAIYRRFIMKLPRPRTNSMDVYAIIIVAVILVSGVFLEATKIVSYSSYQGMVEEYTTMPDEEELKALEAFWVHDMGLVSPNVEGPFDKKLLEAGKEAHEMSCAECHSKPQSAFLGYGFSRLIKPMAVGLDKAKIPTFFWYIHFLACFIGLAYLPFSKMFHIFASPLSLLANAVMDKETSDPANIATKQAMELDACTHCGTCSARCSMAVAFEEIPNLNILPSEKLTSVKLFAAGKELSEDQIKDIQEGVYVCTNCYRCTVACPVGINLQDLWFNVREDLLERGYPELSVLSPLSFYRCLMQKEMPDEEYKKPLEKARKSILEKCELMKSRDKVLPLTPKNKELKGELNLSEQASTFSVCFGCETCTTVCPVVENYENPQDVLGLLPHQIMHSCGLGLRDLSFGSNMLWDCITCYQCQEECPQGVCVTDVLYELKNLAIKNMKKVN
jgi:heterodisulfide reductase subunit C/nitrate reductase gamma subunit